MALVTTKVINGRVVAKGDKCWGDTYTVPHGGVRAQGWVAIEDALFTENKVNGANFLKEPSGHIAIESPYINEVNKGRVVSATRIVHTIVHERIIDEV